MKRTLRPLTKTCTKCKSALDVAEFSTHPARGDGLSSWCKPCLRENTAEWRARIANDPVAAGHEKLAKALRQAKRRAVKAGVEHVPYTVDEFVSIWGMPDTWLCVYCDSPANTVDHVVPFALGGSDSIENTAVACSPCNSSKGSQAFWAFVRDKGVPERYGPNGPKSNIGGLLRLMVELAALNSEA